MKINQWVIALLGIGLAIRAAIAFFLQPGFDEAYYYVYTLYPNWSYFDHPPLVSLVTGFGVWLLGDVSQFSIRVGTLILYTGTLGFLYLTSKRLFSQQTAILTLAIATAIPFFQVGFGILTLPDSPLMFFWSASLCLAAYEFFPAQTTLISTIDITPYRPTYRLALLGLTVGLACLGKYHGFLLGFGLVLFCLLSSNHRTVWRSPWTLAAISLFSLAISPIVLWNWQNDWVSFRFQSARAVPQSGYNFEGLLVTFLVGIGYLFPTFGVPIWWVSLRTFWRLLRTRLSRLFAIKRISQIEKSARPQPQGEFEQSAMNEDLNLDQDISPNLNKSFGFDIYQQKQLLILAVSLPVFLGFTLMGGYRQILPSWHMPGFFGATLLLGQQMAIAQQKHPKRIRNWLWGSSVTVLLILTLALVHVTDGLVQKNGDSAMFGGFWAAKDDPSTQLIDIKQVRQGFMDSPILNQELLKSTDFVFSNNFFLAGQIAMALTPLSPKPITTFDADLRGFAFWESNSQWVGKDGLYITSELFQEPLSKYTDYFQSITKLPDVQVKRGGEAVQIFHIYHCTKLLRPYPRPYGIQS